MKKIYFLILLIIFCLTFSACNISILSTDGVVAEGEPLHAGLVDPVPTEGEVVAEINGVAYCYDEEYLFLLDPEYYLYQLFVTENFLEYDTDVQMQSAIEDLVLRELYALEAEALGLTYADASSDLSEVLEIRQSLAGRFSWTLTADPVLDEAAKDITEKGLACAEKYFELQEQICAKNGLDPEELWAWAEPYLRKDLLICAYEEHVSAEFAKEYDDGGMFESFDAFAGFDKSVNKALMKKYNVTIYD